MTATLLQQFRDAIRQWCGGDAGDQDPDDLAETLKDVANAYVLGLQEQIVVLRGELEAARPYMPKALNP